MIEITISEQLKNHDYFWYTYRSFSQLAKQNIITLKEVPELIIKDENFIQAIKINDLTILLDVRDDHKLSEVYKQYNWDYIFKANFIRGLWKPQKDYPEIDWLEWKLEDWELNYYSKIQPFVFGRSFGKDLGQVNELNYFRELVNEKATYDLVSFTGSGLTSQQTDSRLKFYDFLSKEIPNNKLIFFDLPYYKTTEEQKSRMLKYKGESQLGLFKYYNFLSSGKYTLNLSGIAASQPFRLIDTVIAKRVAISGKILQDSYMDFPCIELPICSYTGQGDWDKAKFIIKSLDNQSDVCYYDIINKQEEWYINKLSPIGFLNQFKEVLKL